MLEEKLMENTAYGKAALKHFGEVPENFRIYLAALQGVHPNYHGMQVTGAEFRVAKSGKNKGRLCIKIEGTERSTYVSNEVINKEKV